MASNQLWGHPRISRQKKPSPSLSFSLLPFISPSFPLSRQKEVNQYDRLRDRQFYSSSYSICTVNARNWKGRSVSSHSKWWYITSVQKPSGRCKPIMKPLTDSRLFYRQMFYFVCWQAESSFEIRIGLRPTLAQKVCFRESLFLILHTLAP